MSKKITILCVCALCFLLYGCNSQDNNDWNVCTEWLKCTENNVIEANVSENTDGTSVDANITAIWENSVPVAEIWWDSIITEWDRDSGTIEPGILMDN